jgi:hypothetical protein
MRVRDISGRKPQAHLPPDAEGGFLLAPTLGGGKLREHEGKVKTPICAGARMHWSSPVGTGGVDFAPRILRTDSRKFQCGPSWPGGAKL